MGVLPQTYFKTFFFKFQGACSTSAEECAQLFCEFPKMLKVLVKDGSSNYWA